MAFLLHNFRWFSLHYLSAILNHAKPGIIIKSLPAHVLRQYNGCHL
jgi:hypothetical protein